MSLTDDWKTGKLKNGWYFCLYENDAVFPALCFDDDFEDYELKVMEVLAPCDYDHFVELTEKVEKLNDRVEWEIGKNNALEKQLIEAREEIKRGREALGLMCDCNDELLGVLKKCKEKIHEEFINQDIVSIDNFHKLLTKITEVLK